MKTIIILVILLIIIFGAGFGIIYLTKNSITGPSACTEEAKICPDGTAVGRNPDLDCEFDPCPESNTCIDLGCPSESIYVGSVNSDKYYSCDCHYANRIKPENIICFISDDDAQSKGYIKSEC